ncbi:amino acid/amide ABC transporter membrane protein 1 (HAAT family) [Pseudorhodoplanes sinuspersici]|nr:amino acid/amide ABC transporter membrane protein 1 (HAAT family) [Pseudorhodoplanes sinuspersici]
MNGAVYALLALALILVFAVTRIIFLPQGEFIAFGALTLAMIEEGKVPPTVYLLVVLGVASAVVALWLEPTKNRGWGLVGLLLETIVAPFALLCLTVWLPSREFGLLYSVVLSVAIVTLMGPFIYRVAFQRIADASILTLLIAAIGVHLALTGLGLYFFGPEGSRTTSWVSASLQLGALNISGQSTWIIGVTVVLVAALYLFFSRTLSGKILVATAVNRLGARLVGLPIDRSGRIAFAAAAFIGALAGVLIAPQTTVYYDSGFVIGLKAFIGAIIAGMVSYPVAVVGAIMVGVIESFSSYWSSEYKEIIVFSLMVPILLWRSYSSKHVDEEE